MHEFFSYHFTIEMSSCTLVGMENVSHFELWPKNSHMNHCPCTEYIWRPIWQARTITFAHAKKNVLIVYNVKHLIYCNVSLYSGMISSYRKVKYSDRATKKLHLLEQYHILHRIYLKCNWFNTVKIFVYNFKKREYTNKSNANTCRHRNSWNAARFHWNVQCKHSENVRYLKCCRPILKCSTRKIARTIVYIAKLKFREYYSCMFALMT